MSGLGKDPITFTIELFKVRTPGAVLVKLKGHNDDFWIPLSQIEGGGDVLDAGDEITIPQWLAEKRGIL